MTKLAKKFWTFTYLSGCLAVIAAHVFLVGCVEVGGGGSTSAAVDADTTSGSDQTQEQVPAE